MGEKRKRDREEETEGRGKQKEKEKRGVRPDLKRDGKMDSREKGWKITMQC